MRGILTVTVLALAVLTGAWWLWGRGGAPPPPAAAAAGRPDAAAPAPAVPPVPVHRPAAPQQVRTDHKVPVPLHTKSRHPPGTRIPLRVEAGTGDGIRLPDGTTLPYLNGMTWAPPVQRSRELGPVAPVVGILVDADGFEWYEHADGSVTTCLYQQVVLPGETYWDPSTKHAAATPAGFYRRAEDEGR